MVVIKYKLGDGEEEPLYEINPIFRKSQSKEDEIYYNSDDESEAQLDFKDEVIERKIKNVNKAYSKSLQEIIGKENKNKWFAYMKENRKK